MRAEITTTSRQGTKGGRRSAAAIAGVLAVVWRRAGVGDVASGAPADGGTFTDVLGSDPGSLDPHMSVFVTTNFANSFAYETLVYLGQDGEIVPGLAESWEETPTSVTYTLKEGITCADGNSVDGDDGRRQLLLRRRSGQPVAAPRPLRPAGHHRRGRRRGPHRRR